LLLLVSSSKSRSLNHDNTVEAINNPTQTAYTVMTEGGGKQRINGETITGIALVFMALLFIWAGTQNPVWASIMPVNFVIIPIGIGFIIVGIIATKKANRARSSSHQSHY